MGEYIVVKMFGKVIKITYLFLSLYRFGVRIRGFQGS